jgi:hypothetical protein
VAGTTVRRTLATNRDPVKCRSLANQFGPLGAASKSVVVVVDVVVVGGVVPGVGFTVTGGGGRLWEL